MTTTATGAYEAKQAPIVNEGKLLNRLMQLIAEYENCYQTCSSTQFSLLEWEHSVCCS